MAIRRMFSQSVTDTDQFLELPLSAQALYFHLGMHADDDGFVSGPKKIARSTGCGEEDLQLLLACGLLLGFESGVVAVRDWRINNSLRNDRYHETLYRQEKAALRLDESERYRFAAEGEPAQTAETDTGNRVSQSAETDTGNRVSQTMETDTGNRVSPTVETERNLTEPNVTEPNVTERNGTRQNPTKPKRKSTGAAEPHRAARFVPPSEEEIREYCETRGKPIDVRHFLDHYASNGWRVGKNPMKDWRAAVRNWERRNEDDYAIHRANHPAGDRGGEEAKRFDELGLYDVC